MAAFDIDEDLRRFIQPSDTELELMWRDILARQGIANRADFLPIETALCFAFGLVTEPSPSGYVNVKKSAPEVRQAAALFGRSESSLQSKYSNLESRPGRDGGRSTDARVGEIFAEFPRDFARLYQRGIESARAAGISDEMLRDFLGAGSGELNSVIDASRTEESALVAASLEDDVSEAATEHPLTVAQRLVTIRLAQQRFARAVLARSNFSCVFCGLSTRRVGLPSARMRVAGHIKPWRLANAEERVSPSNGFAACPTHDAAFEAHLMTAQPDGLIIYAPALQAAIDRDSSWSSAFSGIASHLLLPSAAVASSGELLSWHRAAAASAIEARLGSKLADRLP